MSSHRSWTDGGSASSAFNKRSLRLLVCSGNLGNAAPDLDSLAAWIPADGACSDVLVDSPRYPIPPQESHSHDIVTVVSNDQVDKDGQEVIVEGDGEDESLQDDATRKFDLIVVGLQESTFDISTVVSNEDDTQNEPSHASFTNNILLSPLGELPSALVDIPTALGKNVAKAGLTTANTAKRGITAVKTLATSKDHVKSRQKQSSQDSSLIHIAHRASNALNDLTENGTQILHAMMAFHLPSYHHIVSFQRGEMRLEIFALKGKEESENAEGQQEGEKTQSTTPNPSWVEVLSVRAHNTGRGGLANKGGILAQLLVGSTTRLSFMTAHLEAHEGRDKYKMRVGSLADILGGTQTDTRFDASLTSHSMFVLGDLNFRTDLNLTAEGQDYDKGEHMEIVRSWVNEKNWGKLNQFDELQHALRTKDCLVGFQTLPCLFPPTFKVERKPGYTYKGNRSPSYTDRILWKTIPSNFDRTGGHTDPATVHPLIYEPIDDFTTSDHKPVRGAFEVRLNERLRLRPALHKWHSKLSRQNSLGKATKDRASSGSVHLFVRDMKCQISSTNYSRLGPVSVPDPYLCFMSRPKEVIRMDKMKWKNMWKSVFNCSQSLKPDQNEDVALARSTLGWPRSKKMWATYDPDWGEDEVHFTLQTHNEAGLPLDLTGALMFITLLDHGAPLENHLIGSSVFNLQEIFTATHPLCHKNKISPSDNRHHHVNPHGNTGRESNSQSVVNRALFSNHLRGSLASEISVVSSYQIDEPLIRYGKEMGRIQCVIEAWWIDDYIARSTAKRRVSRNSFLAGTSDRPTSGLLASRRRLNPPQTEVDAGARSVKKGIRFWRRED